MRMTPLVFRLSQCFRLRRSARASTSRSVVCGLLAASLGLGGCSYGDSHRTRDDGDDDFAESCGGDAIREGGIDTDELLDVEPSQGVGVFVEYASGGRWHVFTSCDTELSRSGCSFDIQLQPVGSAPVLGLLPDQAEAEDVLELLGEDVVKLRAWTDYDFDGVYLDTEPGTALSIDVLLDEACGNSFVYWVGDGAIHVGAPSTPFELVPSAP